MELWLLEKQIENHLKFERQFGVQSKEEFRDLDNIYFNLGPRFNGLLSQITNKRKKVNEKQLRYIAVSLLDKLYQIHEANYVYLNLKPENVIVSIEGEIFLTNFTEIRSPLDENERLLNEEPDPYLDPQLFIK